MRWKSNCLRNGNAEWTKMQQNFEGIFSMEYVPLSGIGLHLERNRLIKKIALKALHIVSVWMIKKRILTQKQGTHVDTIKCLTQRILDLLRPRRGGAYLPQSFFLFSWTSGWSDLLKNGLKLKISQKSFIWDPLYVSPPSGSNRVKINSD